jgi:hypothetical protein
MSTWKRHTTESCDTYDATTRVPCTHACVNSERREHRLMAGRGTGQSSTCTSSKSSPPYPHTHAHAHIHSLTQVHMQTKRTWHFSNPTGKRTRCCYTKHDFLSWDDTPTADTPHTTHHTPQESRHTHHTPHTTHHALHNTHPEPHKLQRGAWLHRIIRLLPLALHRGAHRVEFLLETTVLANRQQERQLKRQTHCVHYRTPFQGWQLVDALRW